MPLSDKQVKACGWHPKRSLSPSIAFGWHELIFFNYYYLALDEINECINTVVCMYVFQSEKALEKIENRKIYFYSKNVKSCDHFIYKKISLHLLKMLQV